MGIVRNDSQGVIMDLVYLVVIGLFFALLIGLAIGCARLGGAK